MAFVEGFSLTKAVFPFSRGKNRISQGVDNRGSLISVPLALIFFDKGQITHLICARLKYDLYDFSRVCFGPVSCSFSCRKGPKTPPKKVI